MHSDVAKTSPWLETWKRLAKAPSFAASPGTLVIVLAALAASLLYGVLVDAVWTAAGAGEPAERPTMSFLWSLHEAADWADRTGNIGELLRGAVVQAPSDKGVEPSNIRGVFDTWWSNQRAAVFGLFGAVRHLSLFGRGFDDMIVADWGRVDAWPVVDIAPGKLGQRVGVVGCGVLMVRNTLSLVGRHPFAAVVLFVPFLVIWAFAAGAVCRLHASRVSEEVSLDTRDALAYARSRLWGPLMAAPLWPAGFVAVMVLLLVLGGLFLSIPWVGDLLVGLFFGVALLIAGVLAFAVVVGIPASQLLWPAIATDDLRTVEGFLQTWSYVQNRPCRSVLYLVTAMFYTIVVWMFVLLAIGLVMHLGHAGLDVGASWVTTRDATLPGLETGSKVDAVWSLSGWLDWFGESDYAAASSDKISHFLIGLWMLLVRGLAWSFGIGLWWACCTVIYFALRKDIDDVRWASMATTDGTPLPPSVVEVPSAEEDATSGSA